MANLIPTSISTVAGSITPVQNVLTASDTLTFKSGGKQWLEVSNDTGGDLTLKLIGDQALLSKCSGLGEPTDITTGYLLLVPDTEARIVRLSTIAQYLDDSGNLPLLTGAAGAIAVLLES